MLYAIGPMPIKERREKFYPDTVFKLLLPSLIHFGVKTERDRIQGKKDTLDFVNQSTTLHLNRILPAALRNDPWIYAGKVESATIVLILNMFGVTNNDLLHKPESFWASLSVFNHIWRAFDEVVDTRHNNTTDAVTNEELANLPVYHKFLKRNITAKEGFDMVKKYIVGVIPEHSPNWKERRKKIWQLIFTYRDRVRDTANNKKYADVDVLPFPLAEATKNDVSIFLAEISAKLVATSLNIDDPKGVQLFGRVGKVVQIGDDLVDWEKDWKDHLKQKAEPDNLGKQVRPIENLFLSLLEEEPEEKARCELHLHEKKNCAKKLMKYAPKTLAKYNEFFERELGLLPEHAYTGKLKGILSFIYYDIIPKLPESGLLYKWGRW